MSALHLLATPATAYVTAAGYELGTGRLVPSVAALVGLTGVLVGGWAAVRARNRRPGAVLALVAGLLSTVVGGLHAANAAGGLGTGNGLAGAVIAVVLGVLGLAAGGLALARSRRWSGAAR